jgi:hypothetical protein
MTEAKKIFLQNDLLRLINKLNGDEKARWGKMNAQQMIEL